MNDDLARQQAEQRRAELAPGIGIASDAPELAFNEVTIDRQNQVGNLLAELVVFTRDETKIIDVQSRCRNLVSMLEDIYRERPVS